MYTHGQMSNVKYMENNSKIHYSVPQTFLKAYQIPTMMTLIPEFESGPPLAGE